MGEIIDLDAYRNTIAEELTVDHNPDEPDILICMDDRELHPEQPLTVDGRENPLYSQHAGGGYGFGHDVAVVMESKKSGSYTNLELPIFAMGGLVAKLAKEKSGILLYNHLACAALGFAKEVDTTIVTDPEATFESAKLFKPDLSEQKFEHVVEGTSRLLLHGTWTKADKALRKLETGVPTLDIPGIPAVALADKPHNAVAHTIDYREGKKLDVVRANEEGLASYYSSAGKIKHIVDAIKHTLPVQHEDLLDVYAVRLGAIRSKHLLGLDDQPLPVVLLAN